MLPVIDIDAELRRLTDARERAIQRGDIEVALAMSERIDQALGHRWRHTQGDCDCGGKT